MSNNSNIIGKKMQDSLYWKEFKVRSPGVCVIINSLKGGKATIDCR